MRNPILSFLLAAVILAPSCKKTQSDNTTPPPTVNPIAPDGFNFTTSKNVTVSVQLLTNDNKPLQGVAVNFYSTRNTGEGKSLLTAISDAAGNIIASINIPAYMDTLLVDPAYIGLMRNAKAVINGNSINCVIGGNYGYSGDIVANDNSAGDHLLGKTIFTSNNIIDGNNSVTVYPYMGSYDKSGRPDYLVQPDIISSELLSFINTSFPENKPVPLYHPDYLTSDAETNINIEKSSDVWITFVSEGAGYYNSVGYYKYATNKPPQSLDDIDSVHIAIPNASLIGSGGNMHSGDKIKLGHFEAGTSIGFVLFQNSWGNNKKVSTDELKFFSDDILNPEQLPYNKHSVLLYDDKNKLFVCGFEDLRRDGGSSDDGTSDDDFNDVIFYATSNVDKSISSTNVIPIDKPVDSDGDGVSDVFDRFPNDPARAYIQYFPSQSTWGTLAFEDLWPSTGDYDLNDLVVGYRYTYINNAQNQTVEMYGDFMERATGASFINGFGVQLPFVYSKISSITGQKLIAGYIKTNTNGTEAGQTKAVIIPFDDTRALIPQGGFTNVYTGRSYLNSDTARLYIKFTSPLTSSELGTAPFNPFLISNQRRGYEVHLPGSLPTDKADTKLFGTAQDNTNTSAGKYYLTADNWPWAISFTEVFDYPIEASAISKAYPNFLNWAKSGGTQNADWYTDSPANRNAENIYKR